MPRRDHEPPDATARWGWRYHHTGIPTREQRDRECHLARFGMHVSGFGDSPYGIEWMRFEADSPISALVQAVPHVAFEVDDIEEALGGKRVLMPPEAPSDGLRVAMIEDNGCPIEVMQFEREAAPPVAIRTERLDLAPLTGDDAPRVYEYRALPEVARYQAWVPTSLDEVRRFTERLHSVRFDTPGTWYQFGMRLRGSGLLVGDLGVNFPAGEPRQAEMGFTLAPEHQRQGYATEAVRAVLGHLFGVLGKHRVFASVDPRNAASVALLRRVGMRQEAHLRQSLWLKGEWVDDLVFAILKSEWAAGH